MHHVQEIGSYAGFAAVIGLAVLCALYFSQARDVKRLREWAGRAPERAAEEEARIAAASTQQQQQRVAAGVGAAPTMVPPPTVPGAAPSTATPAPGAPPVFPTRPAPTPAPVASTPILSRPPEPWYRRIEWPEPRYIALIVVGILVIGIGAVYGISHIGNSGGSSTPPAANNTAPAPGKTATTPAVKRKPKPLSPSKITVAVLNGTNSTGLASQIADQLQQQGFVRGNTTNALTQGQQAQSVVEYSANNSAAARFVAGKLGISDTEPIDPQTQQRAGDASVAVIIGADKVPGSSG
jgi:LytR cell envelope-related transcriptional attenuator